MYIFDPVCGALHDRTKSRCRRSRAETTLVCAEVVARIITALESVFHRDKFAANAWLIKKALQLEIMQVKLVNSNTDLLLLR